MVIGLGLGLELGLILKVRGQNVIGERNCPPTFGKVGVQFCPRGGTSKQITISIDYTEICCLDVALINMSWAYGPTIGLV